MKILSKSTFLEIIVILFVILFLYTGISKIIDYRIFKQQIGLSPILEPIAPLIALMLPWVEFFVVALLAIPRWRLYGLYSSLALMVAFTIYISAILTFDKDIPCSCGGVIELLSWKQHIVFNSLFIILALIGCRFERMQRTAYRKMISLRTGATS